MVQSRIKWTGSLCVYKLFNKGIIKENQKMQVFFTCIFSYKFFYTEKCQKKTILFENILSKGIDINGQKDYYTFNK